MEAGGDAGVGEHAIARQTWVLHGAVFVAKDAHYCFSTVVLNPELGGRLANGELLVDEVDQAQADLVFNLDVGSRLGLGLRHSFRAFGHVAVRDNLVILL